MDYKKRVQCINTGEVFPSSKEAAEKYGIKEYRNINKCCNLKRKSAGAGQDEKPLKWRYISVDEIEKVSQEQVSKGGQEIKLRASDFNLDFSKKKNEKFFFANVDKLEPSEVDILYKQLHTKLKNVAHTMRKSYKAKHLDVSQIDKIMQGV
jgi:hypothetical protein